MYMPSVALTLSTQDRPLVKIMISYVGDFPTSYAGPRSILVTALIDTGADVTIIANQEWPKEWPVGPSQRIAGVGGVLSAERSQNEVEITVINRDGTLEKPVLLVPLVARVPGTLLGRDFLNGLGTRITNL